jgi:hypothetical protein
VLEELNFIYVRLVVSSKLLGENYTELSLEITILLLVLIKGNTLDDVFCPRHKIEAVKLKLRN